MMIHKAKARSLDVSRIDKNSIDNNVSNRSTKRAREDNNSDDISLWNQAGISQMQNGYEAEAEACFSLALYAVECSLLSLSCHKRDDASQGLESTIESSQDEKDSLASQHLDDADCLLARSTTAVSQETSTTSYIYQRHEYDEGIDVFNKPLELPSNGCDSVKASTLYFNIGQTRVKRQQFDLARRSFEFAAKCLCNGTSVETINEVECFRAQLSAQIHHNIGNCFYRLGNNEEALKSYRQSFQRATYVQQNCRPLYVAASQNALGVALFHSFTCPEGSGCMSLFKAALDTFHVVFGSQSTQVATIFNNIGRVYYVKNEYKESLVAYNFALSIRRELLEPNSIDLAATICNAGQAYHQLHQYDQALLHYNEFIQLCRTLFGPAIQHRDVAITYRCIGEVYQEQGNTDEALRCYEESLTIGRRAVGESHPEVSVTLNKLGNLHFECEQYDTALKYYNEAAAIEKDASDSLSPHRIVTLSNIAQIYRRQQNFSMALLTYGEMHGLQIKMYGPKSVDVANTLSNMAFMQFHLHEYSSSYDLYSRTLSIQREVSDSADSNKNEIAATLSSMGLVSFTMGSLRQALVCFTESLELRRESLTTEDKDMAILWYNIATVYLEQCDEDMAIQYYKEALLVERRYIDINPQDVIMTLQHIGLVYQRRGELDETLNYFTEALDLQVTLCSETAIEAARLHNLIGNIHLQKGSTKQMMESYSTAIRLYRDSPDQSGATLVVAGHSIYGFSKIYPPSAPLA